MTDDLNEAPGQALTELRDRLGAEFLRVARAESRSRRRLRLRRVTLALAVAVIVAPRAYALGDGFNGDQEVVTAVPATDCPDDVNAVYESAGIARAAYYPDCPSVEEAQASVNLIQQRAQGALKRVSEARKPGEPPSELEQALRRWAGG